METMRTNPAQTNSNNNHSKSKLARTFQKVKNLRAATKIASNNGNCLLNPQSCSNLKPDRQYNDKGGSHVDDNDSNRRAVMEALAAKLFASITSIKASYAELQTAQTPYNSEVIQAADQSVVDELREISELKRSFLKKELDLSPQVATMLAEVQEQQGIMKTYEITIKKLEGESERKAVEVSSMKKRLAEALRVNKSSEKKLSASGSLSSSGNVKRSSLGPSHFVALLQSVSRSARSFVKVLVGELESANWDLDLAVKVIEPKASFSRRTHRCFAFESFVFKTMLEGFNFPRFDPDGAGDQNDAPLLFFEEFKNSKPLSARELFTRDPNSSFSKFLRSKYLQLVHAKMECSVFGNLNQRKTVTSCGFPETRFFACFAEMAKRFWVLHCLAFSFGEEVTVFQVRRGSRFSEVYMEPCVSHDSLFSSDGEIDDASPEAELRVGFTVVPGFKIGKTVFQSQVYLSPAS